MEHWAMQNWNHMCQWVSSEQWCEEAWAKKLVQLRHGHQDISQCYNCPTNDFRLSIQLAMSVGKSLWNSGGYCWAGAANLHVSVACVWSTVGEAHCRRAVDIEAIHLERRRSGNGGQKQRRAMSVIYPDFPLDLTGFFGIIFQQGSTQSNF